MPNELTDDELAQLADLLGKLRKECLEEPFAEAVILTRGWVQCERDARATKKRSTPKRQPRVFPPDSPAPDDVSLVDASNGVRFRALGEARPLRSWEALENFGGDGYLYTWWSMNASSSPEGPLTLTEVIEDQP